MPSDQTSSDQTSSDTAPYGAPPLQPAAPVIILVRPQMGENIGAAARAMLNCGLTELRLVSPRDGWPSERAQAMASGALDLMPPVAVFDNVADALADCHYSYATTARPRDMVKTVLTARSAAGDMTRRRRQGQRTGILFGAERTGMTNDEIAQAGAIIQIPVNPGFSSLNLGQAVLLAAYEYFQAAQQSPDHSLPLGDSRPSTAAERESLYRRLEQALDESGFFRSPELRPTLIRNLRGMFERTEMTEQEVRTFHGIVTALGANGR